MRAAILALLLFILLSGCIQVGGNCKGKPDCYKKAAVYYGLMGDKKEAIRWCKKIDEDPNLNIVMRKWGYNDCIIEVAKTIQDDKICSETALQGVPMLDMKKTCIKMVEQEKRKQERMLNKSITYKHTCPSAMLVFLIIPAVLFMRGYEK